MGRVALSLLGAWTLLSLGVAAHAQTVLLTGPGDFSGSETRVVFDDLGLANGDDVAGASGAVFLLDGAAPAKYIEDGAVREFGPDGVGTLNNFWGYAFPYPDLDIHFPAVMHRVGFEARVNDVDEVRVVLMLSGVVVDDVVVPSRGSDALYFYGFENPAGFDAVTVDVVDNASGAFTLDNLAFEATAFVPPPDPEPEPGDVPVYSCDGFVSLLPPELEESSRAHAFWQRIVDRMPVKILQARLVDGAGVPMGDADLATPPRVQVVFSSMDGDDPVDVTRKVLGRRSESFHFGHGDLWRKKLAKGRMRAAGTYDMTLESGDPDEYEVDPTCSDSLTKEPPPRWFGHWVRDHWRKWRHR